MAVKISMEHFLSSCGHDENANSLTEEQVNQVAKMTKCSSYVVEYLFNVIEELDDERDNEGNKRFHIGAIALAFMHVAMELAYSTDVTKEGEHGDFMVEFFQKMCKEERKDFLEEKYYSAGVVPEDEKD